MKQQRGFTLVELIIVIVILGILAVTAAPRFFDFSGQARSSTIEGLKAAVQGGSEIGYAQNALGGNAAYPSGADLIGFLNITAVEAADTAATGSFEWIYAVGDDDDVAEDGVLYITLTTKLGVDGDHTADDIIATNCYLSYEGTEPPTIETVTSGCQ